MVAQKELRRVDPPRHTSGLEIVAKRMNAPWEMMFSKVEVTLIVAAPPPRPENCGLNGPHPSTMQSTYETSLADISRHYANYLDALADLKLFPDIGAHHGTRSVVRVR